MYPPHETNDLTEMFMDAVRITVETKYRLVREKVVQGRKIADEFNKGNYDRIKSSKLRAMLGSLKQSKNISRNEEDEEIVDTCEFVQDLQMYIQKLELKTAVEVFVLIDLLGADEGLW